MTRPRTHLRSLIFALLVIALVLSHALRQGMPTTSAQALFELTQTDSPPPTISAGGVVTLNLRITSNVASDTYNFNISVSNLPSGAVAANPGTIQVGPNAIEDFQIQISTPSTILPGTYSIQVQATGTRASSGTGPTTVTISSFARFTISGATATPTVPATSTPTATPTAGPICPEGTRDPGNDMGGAKLIYVDTPNNHGICDQGDEDWFKFAAIGGKVYTPDITRFEAGLDLVIELYDSDGQRLAFNDDYFARTPPPTAGGVQTPLPTRDIGPRIQSWRAPRDGIYYIRIRDATSVGGGNRTYTFVVFSESYGPTPPTVTEICRDLYEEDGLPEEAKLITSNEVQPNRRLCPSGDADWVKFFGKAGKIYYVYTDTRPYRNNPSANPSNTETQAGADTLLFLTDRDGTSIIDYNDDIEGPDGSSLDSQIRFVPTVDGFYFVQVKNTGDIGNQFIRYDIVLTQCAPGRDDCGRSRTTVNTAPTAAPAATQTPVSFERTATPTGTGTATATPVTFLEQSQAPALINGPLIGFADSAFEQVWQRADRPVARGLIARSWMWGPRGLMARSEGYLQADSGLRQVQYFDKGRMEVSNPRGDRGSPWFVTSGLLSLELVTGRMQVGDRDFVQRGPADLPIAGDQTDPNSPTYASFAGLVGGRAEDQTGAAPRATIDRAGQVGQYSGPTRPETNIAAYIPETGHNIPSVFWNYLNSTGPIDTDGGIRDGRLMDWVFTMGYPVSEPFWARVHVGGVEREVLIQVFERRVLTYDPANARQWRVEMGNVGRHYYRWRYGEDLPPS